MSFNFINCDPLAAVILEPEEENKNICFSILALRNPMNNYEYTVIRHYKVHLSYPKYQIYLVFLLAGFLFW